ncbi:MAG: methyltransferase domain-containing protein [Gemmatimonadota bacterium]
MPDRNEKALDARSPSAVGLTRLSTRLSFPPAGEALYRSFLRLVELSEGAEFVVVPCGRGKGAVFIAESTGAGGAGADPDPVMVGVATDRAKKAGLAGRVHFEHAPLYELPYQDAVFDLAVGEIELSAAQDPPAAVRELVRVTRPGGSVVLIQLVCTRAVEASRRAGLVERLGVRPLMLMEWKQMLREAGVVDVTVEDWSDGASSPGRPSVLGGLAELFTLRGRLRVLPRAWKRWGWRGVRGVLSRERQLRRLLEEERVLGVSLIKGRRRPERGPDPGWKDEGEARSE